ncbi:MAG: DNA repair protein RadC [Deltaproteobacteria bacterium]|nr:DNA repair protein RadC [Deltaproteobacteria bacterium]
MDKKQWQEKGAGHRGRLRDRFLEKGLSGFSDTEILELLLSFGTPRTNCKEPARQLLKKFGSFAKVLEASPVALQDVKGVGPKNSFALHFVHGVASHYLKERLHGKRYLHSSAEVAEYLVHSMRGLKKEVFTVIYLDSSHAIIDSEVVAEGTLNVNTVYPREIVSKALLFHAAALIIAHNHPSGSLQPSPQDMKLTKTLWLVCNYMQMQLLDHLIIGDGSYSFADNGLMQSISKDCLSVMQNISS